MTLPCLVLGAGGRVGRLLRGAWRSGFADVPVIFHSRSAGDSVDIVAPFDMSLTRLLPAVGLVMVLPGRTYGEDEDLKVNTEFALTGLSIAEAIGCPKVVLSSSAAIYRAQPGHEPFREEDTTTPDRPYGRAKLEMEQAAARWCQEAKTSMEVTSLRMANVVGADMLAEAVRGASEQHPLSLDQFPDGTSPRRSYLSPSTLAHAIVCLAKSARRSGNDVINLADPGPTVQMSAILMALESKGFPIPWQWQPAPDTAIREIGLDTSKLQLLFPELSKDVAGYGAHDLVTSWLMANGNRP